MDKKITWLPSRTIILSIRGGMNIKKLNFELFENIMIKKGAKYFKIFKTELDHIQTSHFGQKLNLEPPKHHQKPKNLQTLNGSFQN